MARSTATSGHRVQCISVVCVSASVYPSRHPPGQAVITSAPPCLQEGAGGSARRLSQQNLPGADISNWRALLPPRRKAYQPQGPQSPLDEASVAGEPSTAKLG